MSQLYMGNLLAAEVCPRITQTYATKGAGAPMRALTEITSRCYSTLQES